MPTLSGRLRKQVLFRTGLCFAVFAAYAFARPWGEGRVLFPAIDLLLVAAILAALLSWLVVRTIRRQVTVPIDQMAEQVGQLASNPSARLPRMELAEFQELEESLGIVRDLYVKALNDLVKQGEQLDELQTEMRQAEVLLQSVLGRADAEGGQSHSMIQRGAGAAHDMVARLTPNLQWMAATPAMQQLLGANITEVSGKSFLEAVHPEDAKDLPGLFREVLEKGEGHNITFRVIHRSGAERYVQMDALARYDDEGAPLHLRCHFVDVTARVLTDMELRRRTEELSQANDRLRRINRDLERLKEGYRDLYHHSPVMYFSLDAEARFAACNETMIDTLGYSREELIGQPYTRLLSLESRERFRADLDAYKESGETQREAQWLKKSGQLIDVWVHSVPLLNLEGQFLRTRSVAQDVTERKRLSDELSQQAEQLRRVNEELLRINRELDDFTYVVSHDLKEPLRTIDAFSTILSQDYCGELDQEATEYLAHLVQASSRMGALIDDLLTLSRAGRIMNATQVCRLETLVETVRRDLAILIQNKNARVRVEGALPAVLADPQRMVQLLGNLISNGLKYNENPQPEVVIGEAGNGNGQPAHLATFYVRDNGIGIDPRYQDQIFKIFRRLHRREEYEGTGAGLAICKKIIEAHGGCIWVESQPGQGATFSFTLPRASAASPDRPELPTTVNGRDKRVEEKEPVSLE